MVAEIQKLEAAARMAMGSFEDHAIGAAAAKPRSRSYQFIYGFLALALVALVVALL